MHYAIVHNIWISVYFTKKKNVILSYNKKNHHDIKDRRQKCGINVDSLQYYYDVVPWADIPVHVVFIIKDRAGRHLQ